MGCASITPASLSWSHLQAWLWVHARYQGAAGTQPVPKPSWHTSPLAEASGLFSIRGNYNIAPGGHLEQGVLTRILVQDVLPLPEVQGFAL